MKLASLIARAGRGAPATGRTGIWLRQRWIHTQIPCAHYQSEIDAITRAIIDRRRLSGDIAEFGCFKGGSTAKLSLAAALTKKRLHVFDSFDGLPEPEPWDAEHQIERLRIFRRGEYAGQVSEVRGNVDRCGRLEVCVFHPGWFEDTLPAFRESLSVAFADVDLAGSVREIIAHVWPLIEPGGVLFVHDATDEKIQEELKAITGAAVRFVPTREALPTLRTKTLAYFVRS